MFILAAFVTEEFSAYTPTALSVPKFNVAVPVILTKPSLTYIPAPVFPIFNVPVCVICPPILYIPIELLPAVRLLFTI